VCLKNSDNSFLDRLRTGIDTDSPEEMRAVAEKFALILPENATLTLSGDLGAGKTVFVKGLAAAWKIEETVTSPTFNLFSIYRGTRNLLHLDAYRLESPDEIEALMIEEFLDPPYCLAIEWPEKIAEWLPDELWEFSLSIQENKTHHIRLISLPKF